ncbi:hypothetical protein BGY98DRAFT_255596 [Russula aff. rugulosa BPL654]|nr:hypothetical protein BGY98DRAFT_255596 [Russula aff. rugulosa BPL654]
MRHSIDSNDISRRETVWLLYPRRPIPHCRAMMCSRTCVVRVYRHHRIYSLLPLLFVALLVLLSHRHRSHVIHAGIPTLSISDVVNNFVSYHVTLRRHATNGIIRQPDLFLGLSHPPQEKSAGPCCAARVVRLVRHTVRRQNRDLQGSDSTLRPLGALSGSDGGGLAGQCTFRKIGSARGAWTSQEKEDKWDDLLERSARAGGSRWDPASGSRKYATCVR